MFNFISNGFLGLGSHLNTFYNSLIYEKSIISIMKLLTAANFLIGENNKKNSLYWSGNSLWSTMKYYAFFFLKIELII